MKSLCVYCGSRPGADPAFKEIAINVGKEAARRGCRIVYGGGKLGLMGATAGAARDAGGQVFGVIPDFLVELEGILEGVDHKVVSNMHERKMLMFEESDAILTLPGGIGTLEELIEVLSWARLALHKKPIVVLNVNEFWSPLQELFNHIVNMKLADAELLSDVKFVSTVEEAFEAADTCLIRERA
ncbi:TIGR00730 family Rossman fold protein [Hyphococcus flavus]|uniref:Cytokinin riboside 5'-monophosphate phosphoribohydrolase n=1 Tax=Hyphococcus flavus TaxID=1866326 RepID=A0AAF0CF26_9PROT|nr:TIGR00730 family Rossman fold protein [Hyphococcus flavus]WDI32111.1 TIGR00730 family Rossman fold protein [Hyphococcus flavus]